MVGVTDSRDELPKLPLGGGRTGDPQGGCWMTQGSEEGCWKTRN